MDANVSYGNLSPRNEDESSRSLIGIPVDVSTLFNIWIESLRGKTYKFEANAWHEESLTALFGQHGNIALMLPWQGDMEHYFVPLFRQIMRGFIILLRKGRSVSNFKVHVHVYVTSEENEDEERLIPLPSRRWDLRRDLTCYRDFLRRLLDMRGLPLLDELRYYLDDLEEIISKAEPRSLLTGDIEFALNSTFFWCSSERIDFTTELFRVFNSDNRYRAALECVISSAPRCHWIYDWVDRITTQRGTRFFDIFDHPNRSRHDSRAYRRSGYHLIRFVFVVYDCYNEIKFQRYPYNQFLTKEEIEREVDHMFPELYASLMYVVRLLVREPTTPNSLRNILQTLCSD